MNAASLEIFYPETGRTEEISQISNWSATWHHSHIYEPDVAPLVPAGAVLVLKQWYDNTADNPNNPDPDQWVYGGSRTGDEMTTPGWPSPILMKKAIRLCWLNDEKESNALWPAATTRRCPTRSVSRPQAERSPDTKARPLTPSGFFYSTNLVAPVP